MKINDFTFLCMLLMDFLNEELIDSLEKFANKDEIEAAVKA